MDRPHFRITNWADYQHYRDRNPPWIKLHRHLVTSEMWVICDDASRVLAIACMMIAADFDGCVPADPVYVMRRCYLHQMPDFRPLVDSGFLEDASGLLACCKRDAISETEKSREEQRQTLARKIRASVSRDQAFDRFWDSYPKKKSKAAALRAWKKLKPDAELCSRIETAVSHAKESADWRKEGGTYIPYPATWLNAGGWDDQETEAPKPEKVELPF